MSKAAKSTLVIFGALVGIIVIVVAGLQLFADRLRDDPEATLLFATSAKTLHEKLQPEVVANMAVLADAIADGASANASEVATGILRGSLAANSWRTQLGYIQPTRDAVNLYADLQREASTITACYAKLNEAWSQFLVGNTNISTLRLGEARTTGELAVSLRQHNAAAIKALIDRMEASLRQ